MPDFQTIIQNNRKERERLSALAHGSKEDLARRLPNGWTVAVTLAHLAFWDLRQAFLLKRWLEQGVKPSSIPNPLDVEAINGSLSVLSEALPPKAAAELVMEAAEAIDLKVEKLAPEQAEELVKMGLERLLHRALHRRSHLDKIDKALGRKIG
jgi:hypothetical protein